MVASRGSGLGTDRCVVFVEPAPAGDQVDQPLVVELAEYVRTERAGVGLLVTPYRIASDGLGGLDVPIELIDGPRLRQWVRRFLPSRLGELDGYRGVEAREEPRAGR